MAKMKTHRGAAKRFRLTGNGKVRRFKAGHSHLLRKKNRKRNRRLRQSAILEGADARRARRLLARG